MPESVSVTPEQTFEGRCYLSGPMRGYPLFNFPAFDDAAALLRKQGWEVISPAEMDRELGFDETKHESGYDFDMHEALKRDFAAIHNADAIIFIQGWEKSQGANAEKLVGEMLGLKLLYLTDEGDVVELRESRVRDHREIITNPITGGQKETRLARFDLLPAVPMWEVAELFGAGAKKYDDRNWEKGYAWSLSQGALLRHAFKWWAGESRDPETGAHHLASVVFHALAQMEFERKYPQLDDRPKQGEPVDLPNSSQQGTTRAAHLGSNP